MNDRLPAKNAVTGRIYSTVHGILVQCQAKTDYYVTLSLADFPENSPAVNVNLQYPLMQPDESISIPMGEVHRLNTRTGFILNMLKQADTLGVVATEMVKQVVEANLVDSTQEQAKVEKDVFLTISNLRAKGHLIVRMGETYYYRGKSGEE